MSTEGGTRAVVAALAANAGIAVSKFVAWGFTGSSSMLSEAIHSVADSGNQVLLLVGGRRAAATPDATHQFGFGRRRYLYAFLVSIVLFLVGGVFAIYEGVHKIAHPEELSSPGWAFGVLVVAIGLEAFSFRTALHEADKSRGGKSLLRYVRDARQPELPVVLLEDAGALVGLCFALLGVTMATVTGSGTWDGVGSMAIGVLLVVIALFLSAEMSSLLVGEAVLPEQEAVIREALESEPLVHRVIHLRTVHVGPDEVLVATKIAVGAQDTGEQIARAIDAAEARVRAALPSARYVFVEPDLDRAPGAGPAPGA